MSLTAGGAGEYSSGNSYSKVRTVNVVGRGKTTTYFYDGQGTDRAPNWWTVNGSLEATYRIFGVELGAKGEVFNVFNRQTPGGAGATTQIANTAFCENTTNPSTACQTAINNFGKFTARSQFQAPRSFRLTALVRF